MFGYLLVAGFVLSCGLAAQVDDVADKLRGDQLDDQLTDERLAAWRTHILPSRKELRWRTIGWRQSFAEGLLAANELGKPLLFYAMNGHPLGCT